MSAQPVDPAPDTGSYDIVVHSGGEVAAVVLPIDDFRRLRALERLASEDALLDAEAWAAGEKWDAQKAAGTAVAIPSREARRMLGLES